MVRIFFLYQFIAQVCAWLSSVWKSHKHPQHITFCFCNRTITSKQTRPLSQPGFAPSCKPAGCSLLLRQLILCKSNRAQRELLPRQACGSRQGSRRHVGRDTGPDGRARPGALRGRTALAGARPEPPAWLGQPSPPVPQRPPPGLRRPSRGAGGGRCSLAASTAAGKGAVSQRPPALRRQAAKMAPWAGVSSGRGGPGWGAAGPAGRDRLGDAPGRTASSCLSFTSYVGRLRGSRFIAH